MWVSPQPPFQRKTQLPDPMKASPTGLLIPKIGALKPPNISGYPTRKKATNPSPKIAKFVDITCEACFALVNPVSTSANPACMKITSTAPITTQSRFRLTATSGSVFGTSPPPS
jgi:hypothetical protein